VKAASDFLSSRVGLTRATLKMQAYWLKLFEVYCLSQGLLWEACKTEDLEGFHQKLLWRTNRLGGMDSPNTVDQALRVLRHYYRWAHQQGLVAHDPTCEWLLRRPLQPEQPVLARDQVLALINLPDLSRPEGLRDQLLLELIFHLRLSLASCRELQVDFSGTELVHEAWERYLREGRPRLLREPNSTLLLTGQGQAYRSNVSLAAILTRYAKKLGLPHSLTVRVLHRSQHHQVESISGRLPHFSSPKNGNLGR
jgi:site-specific recombinase XerD